MANNGPNPNLSIVIFLILTVVYFMLKYMFETNNTMMFVIYVLAVIGTQLGINIHLTNELCGSPQTGTALIYTFLPWLIIFGGLNIALIIFPSWLIPFSNTIGYGIAKLPPFHLQKIFNSILKSNDNTNNTGQQTEIETIISEIYSDESLLINSIPNSGIKFDEFWATSEKGINGVSLFRPNIPKETKESLRKLVKLKNIIAEAVWFSLTGILVSMASYNYIIKSACSSSVRDMEQRHKEYEKEIAPMIAKEQKQPRVYSSYE